MVSSKNKIDKGFSKISHEYEKLEKTSSLINWMRRRVRNHVAKITNSDSSMLELNCGSGIDAVYFAKKGYKIHATDIATGMIDYVEQKKQEHNLENLSCQKNSYLQIANFNNQKYDTIFSNFGGLNCSSLEELKPVFNNFKNLLNDNGKIALVIMPNICFWEMLRIFIGKKHAFRRFKKNGVTANIEGENVKTYYHKSNDVKSLLTNDFVNFNIENICFLAPTGNRVDFPKKHPFLFKVLSSFDVISSKIPFLKGIGDYYIISATKK